MFPYVVYLLGLILVVVVFMAVTGTIKVLDPYQRGVVLTLGKFSGLRGPGLTILVPFLQTLRRADLRVKVISIEPQDVITKDNVSVKVSAVAFYRIVDPKSALLEVENYAHAIAQLAPIALRSNIGQHSLDDLLSNQQALNQDLAKALEARTAAWGVHVENVEIRTVDLDQSMIRAMAQEAEAHRGARARIITAEGEFNAAEKLAQAADVLSRNPMALTLRTLATLKEIGAEHNSTIIFPVAQENLMAPNVSAAALAQAIAARAHHPSGAAADHGVARRR